MAHHETGPSRQPAPAGAPAPLRTLIIFAAIALAVFAIRRLWRSTRGNQGTDRQQPARMVQCAHCGVYVPEHEALAHGERFYCSNAHLHADRHRQ